MCVCVCVYNLFGFGDKLSGFGDNLSGFGDNLSGFSDAFEHFQMVKIVTKRRQFLV